MASSVVLVAFGFHGHALKPDTHLERVSPLGEHVTSPLQVYLPDLQEARPTRHLSTQRVYNKPLSMDRIAKLRAKFETDKLAVLLGNGLRAHDAKLFAGRPHEARDMHVSHQLGIAKSAGNEASHSTRCWLQRFLQHSGL